MSAGAAQSAPTGGWKLRNCESLLCVSLIITCDLITRRALMRNTGAKRNCASRDESDAKWSGKCAQARERVRVCVLHSENMARASHGKTSPWDSDDVSILELVAHNETNIDQQDN
jgi:hypothetical protein